jgi:hypothetical protein
MITFEKTDLYWRDSSKKTYREVLTLLNKLTEAEKEAVELFGESRYYKGRDDGYELSIFLE